MNTESVAFYICLEFSFNVICNNLSYGQGQINIGARGPPLKIDQLARIASVPQWLKRLSYLIRHIKEPTAT